MSDDVLSNAFNKYASFQKARVIRDRLSNKASFMHTVSGLATDTRLQAKFGFVAFSDPEDFLKAWKEMDGKCSTLLVASASSLAGYNREIRG